MIENRWSSVYNHGVEEGMDYDAASTATGAAVTGPPIDEDGHDIEEKKAKHPAGSKNLAETRSSEELRYRRRRKTWLA
jgi:hypothetical protein